MAHKITRDDLEARFRQIQGDAQAKVLDQKQTLVTAVAAAGAVVLLVIFLLGRRSGKKKTTIVEIRRV
jgi:hypothetical protein